MDNQWRLLLLWTLVLHDFFRNFHIRTNPKWDLLTIILTLNCQPKDDWRATSCLLYLKFQLKNWRLFCLIFTANLSIFQQNERNCDIKSINKISKLRLFCHGNERCLVCNCDKLFSETKNISLPLESNFLIIKILVRK